MVNYHGYVKSHLVDMVHAGVLLEGNIATKAQTYEIIAMGKSDISYKTGKIIKNILGAWKFILSSKVGSFRDAHTLLTLQYGLSDGVIDSLSEERYRGRFREHQVFISGTSYVPPVYSNEVSLNRLNLLLGSFDGSLDSLLVIYCYLMKFQFFANTNKRTAFMWVNLALYQTNMGYLLKLPTSEKGRKSFLNYLIDFYENESSLDKFVKYLKTYYLVEVR